MDFRENRMAGFQDNEYKLLRTEWRLTETVTKSTNKQTIIVLYHTGIIIIYVRCDHRCIEIVSMVQFQSDTNSELHTVFRVDRFQFCILSVTPYLISR